MKTPDSRTLRILIWVIALMVLTIAAFACLLLKQQTGERIRTRSADADVLLRKYHDTREAMTDAEQALTDLLEQPITSRISRLTQQIGDLQRAAKKLPPESGVRQDAQLLHAYAFQIRSIPTGEFSGQLRDITVTLQRQLAKLSRTLSGEEDQICRDLEQANRKDAENILPGLILTAGIIALLLILFSGSRKLSQLQQRSMKTLCDGTRELSSGNLEYRFKEITPDEAGQLKYDFNAMARQLQKQAADLQKANNDLREQAEKLLEAHQHKDRFLSNMSHELRTPLNAIIGFSELLEARAGKLTPEKQMVYAKRILTAAGHLLDLITALLDLAKSGAGKLVPNPENLDLSATITEMCEILTPLAQRKKLEVRQEIEPNLTIFADARMIRQIFINLFSNAVKYTACGRITIRLKQTGKACILDIEDTGIGIPEKDQPKLFQDFYRVESADINAVEGVGIGLALSRRLAALNGAAIRFTSKEGTGSTFSLVFTE